MQKLAFLTCVVSLLVSVAQADAVDVGVHVGYTMFGDVEDEDTVFGVQAVYDLSDTLSLELAVSSFSDGWSELEEGVVWGADFDVTPVTLTGACPGRGARVSSFMPAAVSVTT